MDNFVIECFVDGELLCDETIESNQRLLNEQDLDVICVNQDKKNVFVRTATDVGVGYYLAADGRWTYGTREDALNEIKQRV